MSSRWVPLIAACEPPGEDLATAFFARQERGEIDYLVARFDDVPIGWCEVTTVAIPELRNLHVVPSSRGQGVGRAIIALAEAVAEGRGTLTVGVGTDNPRARSLYERLGYAPTGEFRTTTYTYVDPEGVRREATETYELMVKRFGSEGTSHRGFHCS